MPFDAISNDIIGYAIEVHRFLGPGLLESTYEQCLAYELNTHGYQCSAQVSLPITYKKIKLDCAYRVDLLVNEQVIVELKCVDTISKIHEAQLLTYMKLSNIKLGLVLNFNVLMMKNGIRRLVL